MLGRDGGSFLYRLFLGLALIDNIIAQFAASAAVGSLTTLGGVYLSGLTGRREKAHDRRLYIEDGRFDRLRSEGETLYREIDEYCAIFTSIGANYNLWIEGRIDGAQCIERNAQALSRHGPDATRLKFSLACYFPQISAQFDKLTKAIAETSALSNTFTPAATQYVGGRPTGQTIVNYQTSLATVRTHRVRILTNVANEVRALEKQGPR